jgi:hypothetical protein
MMLARAMAGVPSTIMVRAASADTHLMAILSRGGVSWQAT